MERNKVRWHKSHLVADLEYPSVHIVIKIFQSESNDVSISFNELSDSSEKCLYTTPVHYDFSFPRGVHFISLLCVR